MATESQLRSTGRTTVEAQRRSAGIQERQRAEAQKKKQEEQIKTVQDKVNKTLDDINSGKITEYEQIPTDIRQFVNIDKSYFQQRKAITQAQQQQVRNEQYNLAVKVYLGQVSGGYKGFQEIPEDIKKKAKEYAEGRERTSQRTAEYAAISSAEAIRQQTLLPEEREAIKKTVKVEGNQISFNPSPTGGMSIDPTIGQNQTIIPMSWATPEAQPYIAPSIKRDIKNFATQVVSTSGRFVESVGKQVSKIPITSSLFPAEVVRQTVGSPKTIGEFARQSKERTQKVGELAAEGYTDIFRTTGVPLEVTLPERTKTIFSFGDGTLFKEVTLPEAKQTTSAGFFVKGIKEAPSLVEYSASFPLALGRDVLAVGESTKTSSKEALQLFRTEYESQQKEASLKGLEVIPQEQAEKELFPEFEREFKAKKQFEAGILGLTVVGGLGFKGSKFLFSERIIGREGGKVYQTGKLAPEINALRFNYQTEEGVRKIVYPRQVTLRSPVIEKYTTNWDKFLGNVPKERIISPPKTFIDTAIYPYIDDSPTIFARQSVLKSGNLGKPTFVGVLGGKERVLTAEQISKLKVPEYLRRELTKRRFTNLAGISPDTKEPLSYLANERFAINKISTVEVTKRTKPPVRIDINTKRVRVDVSPNLGKADSFSLLAKESPLGKIGVVKYSKIEQVGKRGSQKAIGEVTGSQGVIATLPDVKGSEATLRRMNPFYTPSKEKGIFIIKGTGTKTPLSKTFQVQQTQIVEPIKVPSPPKSARLTKPLPKSSEVPLVTTSKAGTSLYTGTGLYERTEELPTYSVNKITSQSKVDLSVKPSISTDTQLGRVTPQIKIISIVRPSVKPREVVREMPSIKQSPILRPSLVQRVALKLKQSLRTPSVSVPKSPSTPKIPRVPTTIVPKSPLGSKSSPLRKVSEGKVFTAFGRRFGKDVELGKGTKQETEAVLGKFLKTTLGASGKIKEGERILKAEEISLLKDTSFRKSKTNPFSIVEVREKRLKVGSGEIPEIQTFKRRKAKSILGG